MTMKFTRDAVAGNGTCLQGEIDVPFSRLVAVFGEPGEGDDYKVAFEWVLRFADGTVATIYDWKQTSMYDYNLPPPRYLREIDFRDWNVGGKSKRAVELVTQALEETK